MLENRQNLNFVVKYFYFKPAISNELHYPWQDFIGMPITITNTADTKSGQLP